ncbi:MAG: V-type ATP synthase subunit I [Clostridia bacterium]|nr:V-type ATP synthase subunit I [Clostridia bacterium]
MAVLAMSKIKLMGIDSHKEKILDALYRTGCVELSETEEFADTFRVLNSEKHDELSVKYDGIGRTIDFYTEIIEKSKNKDYYPKVGAFDKNFFISYEDFIRSPKKDKACENEVEKAKAFSSKLADFKAERAKLVNLSVALSPYLSVAGKFSEFVDTKTTKVFFGTVKKDQLDVIKNKLSELDTVDYSCLQEGVFSVILVVSYDSDADTVRTALTESEFSACPFKFDCSAKEKEAEIRSRLKEIDDYEEEIFKSVCESAGALKDLKTLYDYYGFCIEKEQEKENFSCTRTTFILEGFVPTEKTEDVINAVHMASNAVFVEITEPKKDEPVPTLLKNNFAVRQTEFITDMYSTPNYKERDPNKAVFFFFMLFMGIIMADIGYGVIMITLGLLLATRIKVDNGTRRLWYNIAIGGIFAIIFGVMFNSLFGISVLPFRILPSPVPTGQDGQTGLMTILLGCLALGVVQIAFGYFMKALNLFKSGDILGSIFDGLCWVLFFIGFVFAAFNFLIGYLMPEAFVSMDVGVKNFFGQATMPGLIVMLSALLIAAATSGRKEKGFGKITKGFGTIYGLINIFSDILSYARLFGLMLSGMIIANTFNDIGSGLFAGGFAGYIIGGVVILIGHAFNIAMGVLGAYIHDSRLQYIEFFGKFYTGEGNKFKPMGSDLKYVYVVK